MNKMDQIMLSDAEESPLENGNDSQLNGSTFCDSSESEIEIIRELKVNMETHGCDLCCEGNFLVNRLLQFGGVLNRELKYACEICDKGFKVKSKLVKHIKTHSNLGLDNSNESMPLNSSSLLNVSGNSSSLNLTNASPSTTFQCTICPKFYLAKKNLQRHIKNKHREPKVCEVCGLAFSSFDKFRTHCATHPSADWKFTCSKCHKQFLYQQSLREHSCISKLRNRRSAEESLSEVSDKNVMAPPDDGEEPDKVKVKLRSASIKSNDIVPTVNETSKSLSGENNNDSENSISDILDSNYYEKFARRIATVGMKPPCSVDCRFKCRKNVPERQRKKIFKEFWKADFSWDSQKQFITSTVEVRSINRRRPRNNSRGEKNCQNAYYLPVNGIKVFICKSMYMNTLSINCTILKAALSEN